MTYYTDVQQSTTSGNCLYIAQDVTSKKYLIQ